MASKESCIESSSERENVNLSDVQPTFENQSNNEEQNEIPNYMTNFILDFLNGTIKNEDEDEQENNLTERETEEESVEDLIQRAERMIREGMQYVRHVEGHNEEENNASHNTVAIDNIPAAVVPDNEPPPPAPYVELSSDSDDDAVIFVNSEPSVIPVIDLSSQSDDRIEPTSIRLESRKRYRKYIPNTRPDSPVEKQFRHSCAVCLENVNQPHSTVCGHIYCGDCIKKTVKVFKKCPTCNKNLKQSNIHPIYL